MCQKKYFRRNFFRKKCLPLLLESQLTGFNEIIESKGWCQTVAKTIILILCLAGFVSQTYKFWELYSEYSTYETTSELKQIEKPAFTICDGNLIRRRYFCETKPDLCRNVTEMDIGVVFKGLGHCNSFPYYCSDKDDLYDMVPKNFIVQYEDEFFELNFTKDNGFQLNDTLVKCEWNHVQMENGKILLNNNPCKNATFIRAVNEELLPGACYTISPNDNNTPEYSKDGYSLQFTLKSRISDYNNVVPDLTQIANFKTRHFYISFHHPNRISNPFIEGIKVYENTAYDIKVSEDMYVRLPSPYSSKCYDYQKDWMKNGGQGPLTKEECYMQCEIDVNFEVHGCVPRSITYPHYKALCIRKPPFDMSVRHKIDQCIEDCYEACLQIQYPAKSEILLQIDPVVSKWKFGTQSSVFIKATFDIFNSKKHTEMAVFESIELFSYIGGYLGMWLGWSILSLCDFFEIIIQIINYYRFHKQYIKKIYVKPL